MSQSRRPPPEYPLRLRLERPPGLRQQQGAAAVLLLLLLTALVALAAYNSDATRVTADAAQLKRATDAAALAATAAYAQDEDSDLQHIAEQYVHANLGLDAAQTGQDLSISIETFRSDGDPAVRVRARFSAHALLKGAGPSEVSVSSAAVARNKSLEVALAIPNTDTEDERNLVVLRRLGNHFAENLLEDRNNAWLALVPYSQTVNVSPDYTNPVTRLPSGPSAAHLERLNNWATPGALRPAELSALFNSGYTGLADRRIPDRRANLLCMYRGLNSQENYFWDENPSGQFRIYYVTDTFGNNSPGAEPISWVGPNVETGEGYDTRWMLTTRGCPAAPLLPLSNDLEAIDQRLGQMSTRTNTNYAIAMGWSAMALAPAFRGSSGWQLDDELPKDFKEDGGDSYKAIVFLVNSTNRDWFDEDSYNSYPDENIEGSEESGGGPDYLITQRFAQLCDSFRQHDLRFFMVVVGKDEIEDTSSDGGGASDSASTFRRVAGPGLTGCAEKTDDITYLSGFDFTTTEQNVENQLDKIVQEIRQQGSSIRLIE